MARKKSKNKIRTELRKKHDQRSRKRDFTREFADDGDRDAATEYTERISGKGSLTRKRTITGDAVEDELGGVDVRLAVDRSLCHEGRVLAIHGASSEVRLSDGRRLTCTTRGLLKSLSTDQRNVVVAGDRVLVRPTAPSDGVIERVEPRRGIISRTSRNRQHVLVANVDLMLIVTSAAEPVLKPNLIDRFIVTAEKSRIRPVICINKIDLIDAAHLQPLAGVYAQLGYPVLLLSATEGRGIDPLRRLVRDRDSVVAGQSGVGKSSLLNAIDPELNLAVSQISAENQKGRHTTTAARLFPVRDGGFVVDTPGIRQFALWDVIPEEVAGYFREIRPWINFCRYPNCSHIHEHDCGVKGAVADGKLDARRYESYCQIVIGD